MDCVKVGKLILSLRKEKGMTQKQLADEMNISDKTISKWERGSGLPDVSLLGELSQVLGADIGKILLGDLRPNDTDRGNMNKTRFFVCPSCGNILTSTGVADICCCGRKLEPLMPKIADEKHKLYVKETEDDFYITSMHEMSKTHCLGFIAYVAYDRVFLIKMYPEQDCEVRLPKMYGGKLYFYCNNHGLWINEI